MTSLPVSGILVLLRFTLLEKSKRRALQNMMKRADADMNKRANSGIPSRDKRAGAASSPEEYQMTADELKRLKRPELLAIMLEQSIQMDRLREELEKTREELAQLKGGRTQNIINEIRTLQKQVAELAGRDEQT